MITEDYVNFEIAKILKEKGFREECKCQYGRHGSISWTPCNNGNVTTFARPTLQMAMKWLREVHNVFISVSIGNHKKDNRDTSIPDFVYYFFYITDTKAVYEEEKQCHKEFSTFEEACEEAIKYSLEHLI